MARSIVDSSFIVQKIRYVLMSWISFASRSEFYILCCIIKLILDLYFYNKKLTTKLDSHIL
jgi:hypothetical protein